MATLAQTADERVARVSFDEHHLIVDLEDGRTLGFPLAWYPRLLHGSADLRKKVEISAVGLHWEELDEDISIAGLIAGRADQNVAAKRVV